MANLAGIVQQLKKERDQAAKTVKRLDAALTASVGLRGERQEAGTVYQRLHEQGSRLLSEHVGRRCADNVGKQRRKQTLSVCYALRRCIKETRALLAETALLQLK
jgi:hypothetical protein